MLDDIAVGPIAEQPAGKSAPPFAIGAAAHVELHEGAGVLHIFPRRAGFAGLQAHDGVAHPHGLARFQGQVAGQAVAFIEQADDRATIRHRRTRQARCVTRPDWRTLHLDRPGLVRDRHFAIAAGGEREQRGADQDRRGQARRTADHDASGLHAS
ncbi:hypothetical protein BF95_03840 [Sphingobium sp. Ant17]|nr:hypothetical protein BF95_03840 [Sphingobium sp. Ant17]